MFALVSRQRGRGDTLADEPLILSTMAGRTDAVCFALDAFGIPYKGVKKTAVVLALRDVVGNPEDIRGTDDYVASLPLFCAASLAMLESRDRTLADRYAVDYAAAIKGIKARRAAVAAAKADAAAAVLAQQALADAKAKGKGKGATPAPVEGATPAPVEGATPAPAEGATPAPAEGATPAPAVSRIDDAIALLDAAVNANTLTEAQCSALRAMVERMAIPA